MLQQFKSYTNLMDDGRRKIHPRQYEEIRAYYKEARSQRQTAKYFNCSRRLIVFILYPERLKTMQEYHKEIKHHRKYYNKDKNREYMRTYRAKKRKHNMSVIGSGQATPTV